MFDIHYALSILPDLVAATRVTLAATICGMFVASTLGLLIALVRILNVPVVSALVREFVEFLRTTPLLVHLYFAFYILPFAGITLPAFVTGVLVLGLHYSSYVSEVYRAGLNAVSRGQWEASLALNMGRWRALRSVILPQAVRPMIPALGNYLIAMFKETTVLATITVQELLGRARTLSFFSFKYLEAFTLVGLIFLALSYGSSIILRKLEHRLRVAQ